ncbi:hypothetical protein M3D75_14565 [Microbacterium enclense]|uniref:hypothetical protein n=1 Tax=Microbacterium enclense TaxID=993073 RepID=UPI0021A721F8|nr:hypothetical protein [Microbacterium enclense]MCT2087343.1 hypothetical protein [Microbacterium enclense]
MSERRQHEGRLLVGVRAERSESLGPTVGAVVDRAQHVVERGPTGALSRETEALARRRRDLKRMPEPHRLIPEQAIPHVVIDRLHARGRARRDRLRHDLDATLTDAASLERHTPAGACEQIERDNSGRKR